VDKKIARLTYNQLELLAFFLKKPEAVLTVAEMEQATALKQKTLGGVLSSLSRTKFRDNSLIQPMGRAKNGVGLRWVLNKDIIDVYRAQLEVKRLLASYK